MKQLNEEQLWQINAILKIYVNTEELFKDANGEYYDENKQVLLPYCGIPISIKQIREIRSVLKSQLKELQSANSPRCSTRALMTEELQVK